MTFLGLEARTDLPKVSYPTALDFFVFLSFAFIFATILQFAFVHYFTKYGSGECYFNFYEDSSSESGSEDEDVTSFTNRTSSHLNSLTQIDSIDVYGVIPLSRIEIEQERSAGASKSIRRFLSKYFFCLSSKTKRSESMNEVTSDSINEISLQPIDSITSTMTHNTPECRQHPSPGLASGMKQPRGIRRNFNSVSKIDKFSRVAFPMLFFMINLLYWIFYLSRSQRK